VSNKRAFQTLVLFEFKMKYATFTNKIKVEQSLEKNLLLRTVVAIASYYGYCKLQEETHIEGEKR